MRKHIFYPLLALFLGLIGAVARSKTQSDPATGLPDISGGAAIAVFALCIVAALIFLFFALKSKGMQAGAFYAAPCPIHAGLLMGSAALLLLATTLQLKNVMESISGGTSPFSLLLDILLILFAVPSVVCVAFLAKDAKAGEGRTYNSLTVVIPVFYCWMWLIEVYRRHTADPILWDYIFLLLATVFLLVSVSLRAGFSFGDGKPRLAVFCGLAAIFLAPMSLVDFYGLPTLLATLGLTLYAAASLTGLLRDIPMPELPKPEIQTEVSDDE